MTETIIGTVDLALVALYAFWIFFAALIWYLQRENMREGYPLVDESGAPAANQGPFPVPSPKTFRLPFGRGEVTVPSDNGDKRELALGREFEFSGYPYEPTGDPLADGVGPAAWAARRDVPELDGHGLPKIVPMRMCEGFAVSAGRDPRGLPVFSGDGVEVGHVTDVWVDRPEQMARYLEIELSGGTGRRLLPMPLARVRKAGVKIHALYAAEIPGVPQTKTDAEITLLEEDRISAYWCGGKLYADPARLEPQI
tara:strand:- start:208 stop:969 length:762 start_codon:yes stop_codon:yes gene_type:complete